MKSRKKIILACSTVILSFCLLFIFYGYEKTWHLWNIFTMSPHFADLRIITHSSESYSKGLDPMVDNPGDPWKRKLNYPRIWQCMYTIGINQSHTTFIGIGFILLFFTGICIILPHAGNVMLALVAAAVISPATLLGIERGNTDLLIFFLVAVSVAAVNRHHVLSAAIVLLGFVLKLYPIFGCAALLRQNRSLCLRYAVFFFAFVAAYVCLTYSDLQLIGQATPRSIFVAYGVNILWMHAAAAGPAAGWFARILSYLVILFALWQAMAALRRADFLPQLQSETIYLDAFRAGAAIYIGTFLVGNNWDYRLLFLILTIPQLTLWARSPISDISWGCVFILSCILLSQWYLLINTVAYYRHVSFILDEIYNWLVFAGLLYLLFWSMPHWVKEEARKMKALS